MPEKKRGEVSLFQVIGYGCWSWIAIFMVVEYLQPKETFFSFIVTLAVVGLPGIYITKDEDKDWLNFIMLFIISSVGTLFAGIMLPFCIFYFLLLLLTRAPNLNPTG